MASRWNTAGCRSNTEVVPPVGEAVGEAGGEAGGARCLRFADTIVVVCEDESSLLALRSPSRDSLAARPARSSSGSRG